jgi:hypothetical protein
VQAGSDVTGDLRDATLHGRVDVLVTGGEDEGPVGQLLADAVQSGQEDVGVVDGEQPAPLQAADVRPGPDQVVRTEPAVIGKADRVAQELIGRRAVPEPPVPQRHPAAGPRDSGPPGSDPPTPTWRVAHVATPRPQSRTKPSAS